MRQRKFDSRFGDWTRAERRTERAALRRRHYLRLWQRRALVVLGCALILFAAGFSLASLRPSSEGHATQLVKAPASETLRLTIPKMKRVKNLPVYTAASGNRAALDSGAIHLKGTGFPWQRGSNVYIAGHRLGYPNTGSFLVFYDLDKLTGGDRVVLRDASGRKYIYEVFKEITVKPDHDSVTKPVAGENVVSLQSCTLPNYHHRLIVQARLVDTSTPPKQANGGSGVSHHPAG